MIDIVKAVGDRVRHYRQKAGLSQIEFSEMTGLHHTYISQVECGHRNVSIEGIDSIIKALGLSYDVFFANLGYGDTQNSGIASECYDMILKMDDKEQRTVYDIVKGIAGLANR